MTAALFGLRSSITPASDAAEVAGRAKQAALLFGALLFEAGGLTTHVADGVVAERYARQRLPESAATSTAVDGRPGSTSITFEPLLSSLRRVGCDWAGVVAAPHTHDFHPFVERTSDEPPAGPWMHESLARDLDLATRLGGALLPGRAAAAALAATPGVAMSARAAAVPGLGAVPWETVVERRAGVNAAATRRLVLELLALASRGDSETTLATWDAISDDIGELLWSMAEAPPTEVAVIRMAVPADPGRVRRRWSAFLIETQPV